MISLTESVDGKAHITTALPVAPLPPVPLRAPAPAPAPPTPPAAPEASEDDADQGTDEDAGVIRCICLCEDDDGFTIQCDRCLVWQHCACFGMSNASVPDEYLCEQCDPRPVDAEYARLHQKRRRQEEARKVSFRTQVFESAANAAWNTAIGGDVAATRRRPPTTPDDDDDARSKKKRSRSGQRKPRDDDEHEKLEAWQVEYTDISANRVRADVAGRLDACRARAPLTAREHDGFWIAPLRHAPAGIDAPTAPDGLAMLGHESRPIAMACTSLAAAGARTYVRTISDQVTGNFFNNVQHLQPVASEPQRAWRASKTFCRPVMHGLFADAAIPAGAFIGEMCGDVYDADAYRRDPISQYAAMGTGKPHVRLLPPPLSIAIDARMYGNLMRFARASCHPNAVVRPIVHGAQLRFGLFALAPIPRSHEITVGWDWDDQHIVHLLPALVQRPWAIDDTPRFRRAADAKQQAALESDALAQRGDFPYASTLLSLKCNGVVSVLLGVATCGCLGPSLGGSSTNAFLLKRQNCAVTQLLRIAQGMPLLYTSTLLKSGTKPKPITLAPLVGAFRGWAPHEVPATREAHVVAKLAQNGAHVQRVFWADETLRDVETSDDEDGYATSATEPMSDDDYASDTSDPLVAKALEELEHRPSFLPLKKRVERTHIKARMPKAKRKRDGARTDSAKRQKVRALLESDAADDADDAVPEPPLSPTRQVRVVKDRVDRRASGRDGGARQRVPTPPMLVPTRVPRVPPRDVSPRTAEPAETIPLVEPPTPKTPGDAHATLDSVSGAAPVDAMGGAPGTPSATPVDATGGAPGTPSATPVDATGATPEPRAPPKRLSLAEYKKRLTSRRQSQADEREASELPRPEEPALDATTESHAAASDVNKYAPKYAADGTYVDAVLPLSAPPVPPPVPLPPIAAPPRSRPPPARPPGPPPPMPPSLRAAQHRADEHARTHGPPPGPPPRAPAWGPARGGGLRPGAGFGRGGWHPV